MKITCTFDDTTHKVVPIVANELMLDCGYYYTESALHVYSDMVKAAPPYPADNNIVETLDSWIPCSERLPEAHTSVLVVNNFGGIYTCRLPVIVAKNSALDLAHGIRERFTHWMAIPAVPKGE